ncbi:uncharacterized protein LOC126833692 [Adelges cooleyi]|uniref:uncharacterized protein LOC126833692 n=1 Tax=Adelges cooleyi TaxID=133065 RepID=UPI0021804936|nr:uncharacterized protein LOC126833692 [Adelges cooleyi]
MSDHETLVISLTTACQNACSFIKNITEDNELKYTELSILKTENSNLQSVCSELKLEHLKIEENIRTLAKLLNFTVNENDSVVNILVHWISTLTKRNEENKKKRKLNPFYSPLKLTLKEDNETSPKKNNDNTTFASTSKTSWRLDVKRNGNPSDLLKKSKQTVLSVQPVKSKAKLDITIFNSSIIDSSIPNINDNSHVPKKNNQNILSKMSCEILEKKQNVTKTPIVDIHNKNNALDETMFDPNDCSVSHFNKIHKPIHSTPAKQNFSPIIVDVFEQPMESNNHDNQDKQNDLCEEIIYSPLNISINKFDEDIVSTSRQQKSPKCNMLDSFDIIPGFNNKNKGMPNYKFKESPVRKHNERKLLNGWDCEECRKFYEAINDNPTDAKNAMNQFSRHRSVKHQHIANTPPGLWDPL